MFPAIRNIKDVLSAIEGRGEFIVIDKGWFTAIDYVITPPGAFDGEDAAIRRECRGIKFDAVTGDIIARPFEKFFNVGERSDTILEAIGDVTPTEITLKFDGSMVHGAIDNDGEVVLMTRKGRTEEALKAEALLTDDLRRFISDTHKIGSTAIFEFTSPDNRIVVPYDESSLTLLAVRNRTTGEYTEYAALTETARNYGVDYTLRVKPYPVRQLVELVRTWEVEEGIVAVLPSGQRVKIKADAYVLKHRAKDRLSREREVLELILDGKEDDLLPLLDDASRDAVVRYASDVRFALSESAEFITDYVAAAKNVIGDDVKAFALGYVKSGLLGSYHALAYKVFRGANAFDAIKEIALHATRKRGGIEDIRPLIGKVDWETYQP